MCSAVTSETLWLVAVIVRTLSWQTARIMVHPTFMEALNHTRWV